MNSENGRIGFSLALDDSELKRQIASAMNEFGRMGNSFEEEGDRMDAVISKIAKGLSGIAAGWSIKEFTTKVAQVRGEFQQLEIAFETMLGSSSKANELMNQLTRTAAITPFDLQGVAQGAKQLLAYGTQAEEVNETLTRLGDIAAGLSIPLGDLVYLYGTTMTQGRLFTQDLRQFMGRGIPLAEELAAQFGVTKDKVGELVTAGKVGAEEVKQAIWSMTNEGSKFGGLMEKQSASITGQISNIEDAVDSMFNEIGKQSEGAINTALSGVSYLVENYKEVGAILASIATAYGTYKAAVIAVNVAQKANIAILRQAVIEKRLAATASVTLGNAEAIAAAKGKLLAIAQKQIVTSIKGMGAMLTNPYVLLAAAVGAAVYGIYKLVTAESAQEQAAKTLNNRLEELAESQQKYNDETEEAIRLAEDDSAATIDRDEALQLLIARYPSIIQKYIDEKGHLRDILGLKKEIAEADGQKQRQEKTTELKNSIQSAHDNYMEAVSIINGEGTRGERKGRLKKLVEQYKKDTGTNPMVVTASTIRDYYKSLAASSRKSYNRNLTENKITDFTKEGGKLEGYSDSQLKDLQKTLQNYSAKSYDKTSAYISQLDDYLTASDRQSLLTRVNAMISARGETKGTSSGWVSEAKKKWQNAEKAYNDYIGNKGNNVSQATFEAKAKELKQAAEDAKKAYESLGGSTKSAGGSQSASDKRIKAAEDAANKEKELELNNQQERLKLQQDGTQKELDEIKLSYDKKKAEIEKQAADLTKANKEAGTKGLNANGLTAGQQATINEANQLNMQQMSKSIEDLYKEPLSRYQDYTDKRLAIEKKFNDDITLLEQARLNASESGSSEQLAKIEKAIAQAKAEKTKELLSNDLDILKESPEYVRAFEDLKNTSSDTLTYLVDELERLKGTAAASLSPKDLREYTDAIQSIMDELDSRDPFKALADRQKELVNANARVVLAKKNLDAVNSGKSVNKIKVNADGSEEITDEYLTAAEALAEYNKAKDEAAKASNRYSKAEKIVLDDVNELANAVSSLGDTIGGQAGEILGLIGSVSTCVTTTIQGISDVAKTGAEALSTLEKASVILSVASAIISALKTISSLGSNKQFKQYEEYAAKIDEINALTDAVSDYKIAVTEARQAEDGWFSEDSLRQLRDYKEVQTEVYEAYVKKAMEAQAVYRNESGGGWLTGAINWAMANLSPAQLIDGWKDIWGQGDYKEGTTAAINNLRIETRKKSSGFLGSGIGAKSQKTQDLQSWINSHADEFAGLDTELFDEKGFINTELAQSVIDNYGEKLVGETKETLEELIELKNKYDEYLDQLHEYVSSLYEPLVGNFVDSMWDWFNEGKDALDSFKDYAADTFKDIVSDMLKTIVLDKVVGSFSDDIAAIYEDYANGTVSEADLMKQVSEKTGEMIDRYEANVPTLQNLMTTVDEYLEKSGIDLSGSSTSQDSSVKGFQTMSQDTADELNGRFTAIQMDSSAIRSLVQQIAANSNVGSTTMTAINSSTAVIRDNIEEMRNLSLIGIDHLETISKNTHELYEMNDRLAKIEKNTRQI